MINPTLEFKEIELPYETQHRDLKPHIGAVLLSTDHSVECEWHKILNQSANLFVNRLEYSGRMNPLALATIQENLKQAAMSVATGIDLDVILFGCTSASIVIGNEVIAQHLNVGRTKKIPTTNPFFAATAALRAMNAKKISIYSPYPNDVNQVVFQEFKKCGFEVVMVGALMIEHDIYVTYISKQSIFEGVEKLLEHEKPDALFLSCTNLRVIDFIDELEQTFGVPIVTSNQAMYWHAFHLLGIKTNIEGYGKLLAGVYG